MLAVSENNRYLEAALLLDDYLEVTEARRETLTSALANGRFDAAVVDLETAPLPPTLPGAWLPGRQLREHFLPRSRFAIPTTADF